MRREKLAIKGEEVMQDASKEEEDILHRSTKRNKGSHPFASSSSKGGKDGRSTSGKARESYRDSVMGDSSLGDDAAEERDEDGDVSDDDVIEEVDYETWFGMEMTREGKIEVMGAWRNSLIIKLVGRTIVYH